MPCTVLIADIVSYQAIVHYTDACVLSCTIITWSSHILAYHYAIVRYLMSYIWWGGVWGPNSRNMLHIVNLSGPVCVVHQPVMLSDMSHLGWPACQKFCEAYVVSTDYNSKELVRHKGLLSLNVVWYHIHLIKESI